mmetsp:Transcript_1056/g.2712  ORF Transcript_1056/g.2712 Transcript_1056/m.2712 type:complete len:250 (-) Transcript_1056:109-858(-)
MQRLLLSAILSAAKFLEEFVAPFSRWAEIGGVSILELKILELEFLFGINFDLYVSDAEFCARVSDLDRFAAMPACSDPDDDAHTTSDTEPSGLPVSHRTNSHGEPGHSSVPRRTRPVPAPALPPAVLLRLCTHTQRRRRRLAPFADSSAASTAAAPQTKRPPSQAVDDAAARKRPAPARGQTTPTLSSSSSSPSSSALSSAEADRGGVGGALAGAGPRVGPTSRPAAAMGADGPPRGPASPSSAGCETM